VHLGQEGNLDQVMIINYSFPNKEILDFRVMVTINREGQFVTENQADIDEFLLSSISRFEINMNKLLQKVRKGLMEIL
jgi:hypothetical protein